MSLNKGFDYRKRLGAEATDCRVLDYLARHYPACTSEEWLRRIEANRVLLDGIPVHSNQRLLPGQVLTWARPPWKEPNVPCHFAILYQDERLLAVAKPAGLPTLPGGGRFMQNTLLSLVRRRFPGANPLHRLGRGTSGIVLFALTHPVTKKMFRNWSEGKVLKLYHTLVEGHPHTDAFDVHVPIGKVPHKFLRTLYAASAEGKPASSHAEVLERRKTGTLLRIRIDTGRPHQIRIHMAAAGFPLVGDPLYGPGGVPAPDSRVLPSAPGYNLHGTLLGFPHPETDAWTEIFCLPPPLLRSKNEQKQCFIPTSFMK